LAELATEPAWLEERRQKGAALVESLPSPTTSRRGWEFTDLASLDLDSYTGASASVEVSGARGATVVSLAEAVESHAESRAGGARGRSSP
jgi:Fe-S cluster assembly protein SufD